MSVLTKIATGKTPTFKLFSSLEEEKAYWLTVCAFCKDEDCNDDCIFTIANCVDCDSCNGKGRIKFLMRPEDKGEAYWVITSCGMCDGIGLV